eukprot:GSA25T00004753001.1
MVHVSASGSGGDETPEDTRGRATAKKKTTKKFISALHEVVQFGDFAILQSILDERVLLPSLRTPVVGEEMMMTAQPDSSSSTKNNKLTPREASTIMGQPVNKFNQRRAAKSGGDRLSTNAVGMSRTGAVNTVDGGTKSSVLYTARKQVKQQKKEVVAVAKPLSQFDEDEE